MKLFLIYLYYFLIGLQIFDLALAFYVIVVIKCKNDPGFKRKMNDFIDWVYNERLAFIGATIILSFLIIKIKQLP